MHRLKCLRQIHLKTLVAIGLLSLLFTFILLIFGGDLHSNEKESLIGHPFPQRNNKIVNMEILKDNLKVGNLQNEIEWKDDRPPLSVARIAKYCNIPHAEGHGVEGVVTGSYKLLSVHVVIRHGDRSPIYNLVPDAKLNCLTDTSQYSHIPKINNYVHIMEAAQSSSAFQKQRDFKSWSLYPTQPNCGSGQLTGQGAIQHILNGIHYSERYMHKHNLIDLNKWSSQVIVHSTGVPRTYQSALAFMYGLLPEFDFEKLQIRLAKYASFCEHAVFGSACTCPGLDTLDVQANSACGRKATTLSSNSDALRSHIADVLNTDINLIPKESSLMDGLSTYFCHSHPLPCQKNGVCITSKTIETIWNVLDRDSTCLASNPAYVKKTSIVTHGFLYRIAREFNIVINNGSTPKFHLYSGHDSTLSPIAIALGLKDIVWPGYANRITFELYQSERSDNFIRVLQNGKDVTSQVKFCSKFVNNDGLCSFSALKLHLKKTNLRSSCDSLMRLMKKN